jgi:hypothetical protein
VLVTDVIKSAHGNDENRKNKRILEISTDSHVQNPLKVAEMIVMCEEEDM